MTSIGAFISGCSGPVLSTAERDFFARTNPWGLILFKRNCETPEQLKRLTGDFRDAVGRKNAPVFIDQEGGRVQRLGPPSNAWRRYPAARAYGDAFNASALAGLRAARNVGRLMAEDLIAAGITANCVPVLDVPQPGAHEIVGNRAYSDRIEAIMALARAHAAGFADGGVLPVIKHIPGHGRAAADTHVELPTVNTKAATLRRTDFAPFKALRDAPFAMTAHVIYADLDPDFPATTSRMVIDGVIRKTIGFDGALMSDDLNMQALSGTLAERAFASQQAGCDLALHCNGNFDDMVAVASGLGHASPATLRRLTRAMSWLAAPKPFDRQAGVWERDALLARVGA